LGWAEYTKRGIVCQGDFSTVTEQELAAIKWPLEGEKTSPIATNMDTSEKGVAKNSLQPLENIGSGAWI
jgi:hypothetical protein